MTRAERDKARKMAKKAMNAHGYGVPMKYMSLLETATNVDYVFGDKIVEYTYVMFMDTRDLKQYQCYYGSQYYTSENPSLYMVQEYEER